MPPQVPGYHLDRLLGAGASEVWLAWPEGSDAGPFALKWPAPGMDGVDEQTWEAAVLGAVHHPNLVPLLGVQDGAVLVLPFLPGGSLRDLLDERGTLTAGEAVAILGPVAAALDALHGRGLVHGDLKPNNVLLDAAGTPVLADLGCARTIGGAPAPAGFPRVPDRLRAATPAYLDPGQGAGGAARVEADVFALGVTAYELLTGRRPHRGEPAELMAAAAAGVHRPLGAWPGIALPVGQAVEAAIHANPERRPRSASALVSLLAAAVDADDIVLPGPARRGAAPVRPVGRRSPTRRFGPAPPNVAAPTLDGTPVRRRFALVAVVLAAVVVAGVAARAGDADLGTTPVLRRACPAQVAVAGPGRALAVDVDGDGCAESARWHLAVLTVEGPDGSQSYRLGQPGDQILAGDWDGDGSVSVAVYRPRTGEVRYVDHFPERIGQQVKARRGAAGPLHGRARVVRGPAGLPVVLVDPPG